MVKRSGFFWQTGGFTQLHMRGVFLAGGGLSGIAAGFLTVAIWGLIDGWSTERVSLLLTFAGVSFLGSIACILGSMLWLLFFLGADKLGLLEPAGAGAELENSRLGRLAASFICGIIGTGLAVGGLLQLGVGVYRLAYPTAWHVSYRPEDQGLGSPAIATPDTIWMSPTASNTQNLLVVSIASIAGGILLVAAWLWMRGTPRSAIAITSFGAALFIVFLIRLHFD